MNVEKYKNMIEMYKEIFNKYMREVTKAFDWHILNVVCDDSRGVIDFTEYLDNNVFELEIHVYVEDSYRVEFVNTFGENTIYDFLEEVEMSKEEADKFTKDMSEIVKKYITL